MTAQLTPPLDRSVYNTLKRDGRLNLLLRLSEPMAMKLSGIKATGDPPSTNVIPFVSRAEQLAFRRRWQQGRFVKLSWPPDQRAALIRQDAIFREADVKWAERHGRAGGSADVLEFVQSTARG